MQDYTRDPNLIRDPTLNPDYLAARSDSMNTTIMSPTPVTAYVISAAIVAVVVGAGAYFLASDFNSAPSTAQRPTMETPSAAPTTPAQPTTPAPATPADPATPGAPKQ